MSVTINTVAKVLPPFSENTAGIIRLLDKWLKGQDSRFIKKARKIFENAAVDERYSIMPPGDIFIKTSFEEKNNIYKNGIIPLGEQCLQAALDKAGWKPSDLDYLITISCTGFMIPALDAHLINRLELRQDVVRLPVTEMGCAGGVSGIIYAYNFLKSNPGKRAAVLAVEAPTATFQTEDFSMVNIVSAAIFGDGAACALLSSCPKDQGPEILGASMYHFFDTEHLMGFDLTNSGLKMVLDIEVPEKIAEHFSPIVHPFLKECGTDIDEINHLVFHPGGKKIIQTVENLFNESGKNINHTKEILRLYGNMSSATVLYVLERFMDDAPATGEQGLMLSFGPGFSAQRVLLKWQEKG